MTATPEEITTTPIPPKQINYLESLFYLGYAESEDITIYKDDKHTLIVKFRTLTPNEIRDVFNISGQHDTMAAQLLTEKLEILARSIVHVNNMPLIWTATEREEYFKKEKRQPSPLEMSRDIIVNKIKSLLIIETLYDAYREFTVKVESNFEDIKKKLKNPSS